jgi:hypothetical protein
VMMVSVIAHTDASDQIGKALFYFSELPDAKPNKKPVTARLSHKPGKYSSFSPPSRHQRNPSITPTIGLRE